MRVRFIGRTEMLPEHVQRAIAEMEEMTAENKGWVPDMASLISGVFSTFVALTLLATRSYTP